MTRCVMKAKRCTKRMVEQNVACTCQRYAGVIHGFFQLGGISLAARHAMEISPGESVRQVGRYNRCGGNYSSSFPPSSYEPNGFAGRTM
jgi:acetyl esterase